MTGTYDAHTTHHGPAARSPDKDLAPVPRRVRNTLFWAALLPTAAVVGGAITHFPYGMLYVGFGRWRSRSLPGPI